MRYVALAAVVASLTVCLGLELLSQRKIEERQKIIEQKRRELEPLHALAAEVESYQAKKDALQKRIDLINQLKIAQRVPLNAMQILAGIDLSNADSIAIEPKAITINSHAEVMTNAEVLERRGANGHFVVKVKI